MYKVYCHNKILIKNSKLKMLLFLLFSRMKATLLMHLSWWSIHTWTSINLISPLSFFTFWRPKFQTACTWFASVCMWAIHLNCINKSVYYLSYKLNWFSINFQQHFNGELTACPLLHFNSHFNSSVDWFNAHDDWITASTKGFYGRCIASTQRFKESLAHLHSSNKSMSN